MRPVSLLLFLLFPAARAFSPAALPTPPPHLVGARPQSLCIPSSLRPLSRVVGTARCRGAGPSDGRRPFPAASSRLRAASGVTAQRQFRAKKRIATLMAFLTGWADFMFIKKYNFFATMMTGNSMKMAHALVDGRARDAAFFLSIIASYVLGVGAFRKAEYSCNDALRGLFAPIVAACFVASDYLSWVKPACTFVPAMLLSGAWGIINSVGSEVTGTLVFVVTGAMTRLTNMVVDRLSRAAGRQKISREGALMSLSVVGGFVAGAAWSALLVARAPALLARGAFSLLGLAYGLLFLWLDREALGAWWSDPGGRLCDIDADEVDCR